MDFNVATHSDVSIVFASNALEEMNTSWLSFRFLQI